MIVWLICVLVCFFLRFILYETLCVSWTWLTISFPILGNPHHFHIILLKGNHYAQPINIFYWSIVDLQYYVSFRCTTKWFSYILFQIIFHNMFLQDFEYNSLCCTLKYLLLVYFIYSSLYLLIPYSWFVLPSTLFPFGNHKFVFYVWCTRI